MEPILLEQRLQSLHQSIVFNLWLWPLKDLIMNGATMKLMHPHSPQPRPALIPFRIFLMTFLGMLLAFAISTFVGILGSILWGALHHTTPKLTLVYRHFAPTIAIVAGVIVLIAATVHEIRYYRQSKVLAAIERLSL